MIPIGRYERTSLVERYRWSFMFCLAFWVSILFGIDQMQLLLSIFSKEPVLTSLWRHHEPSINQNHSGQAWFFLVKIWIFLQSGSQNLQLQMILFHVNFSSEVTDSAFQIVSEKSCIIKPQKFAIENLAIFCIRFAPNHRYIIGTSQSGHVNYFDPKDGTMIDRILGHSDAANSVTRM